MTALRTVTALPRRKTARYGWHPDLPDPHDLPFTPRLDVLRQLPDKYSLRGSPYNPPIMFQDDLGACTSFGIGRLFQFVLAKEGHPVFVPSHLFLYYFERYLEGTVGQDSGAQIRDGMKVIAKMGVPPETLWPYDVSKFAQVPPQSVIAEALKHQALIYSRLIGSNAYMLKSCIAAGYPLTFGFTVYESFESDEVTKTGIVPLPQANEQAVGGHCVAIVGYDDDKRMYEIANSWGADWGDEGYCWMPYTYVNNPSLASDFWTLRLTE